MFNRYIRSPYQLHCTIACRMLWYFKGAPDKRLYYRLSSRLDIVEYSDTVWTGDPIDCRSTNSYCTFVRGNLMA